MTLARMTSSAADLYLADRYLGYLAAGATVAGAISAARADLDSALGLTARR